MRPAADVLAIVQLGEKIPQLRMIDRPARVIRLEIAFGNIGFDGVVVHQHVIPRFVLGRPGSRDLLIPRIGALKFGVHVNDDAAIVEAFMVNNLSNGEFSA